jgi:two-component system cell cycle sensor histidine kinase/response regulator CckA
MRVTDTTRRADSEATDFYHSLVDQAGDLMFTVDADGRLTYVNAAVARVLHYPDADLLGRPAIDLVRADRRDETLAFYVRQAERALGDTYCEVPVLARHGGTVWLGVHARIVEKGEGRRTAIGVARDVTDRRRVEEALRQSEERYRQAFDENLAGVYVISPSGQIRSGNPAFVRIYGFPSVIDALGANLGTLYPEGHLARLIERVRLEGAVQQQETAIRRVDGTTLHVIESLVGRFDEARALVSINGYVFDDTPRKELQAEMRQSQKMEAIGRLAGGVAHDFNNILMVINGLSETVIETLEPGSPLHADLAEILEAGRRATALTSQLLAFSRKRVLQASTFDLDEAITAMKPLLRRLLGSDIRLEVDTSSARKWILADRGQIEQVLLNLAANGRDAMPQGGRLRIETAVADRTHEFGVETIAMPEVVLRLIDSGEGMSPDVQARVFEPYFTTKERGKGTGLGLSTVYAIVSDSGGAIRVDSEIGSGTRFTIALPLADAPEAAPERPDKDDVGTFADNAQPAASQARQPADAAAGRTVLVVEDEAPVRQIVTNALRRAGHRVLATGDPASALMLLREHGAGIQLLVTDIIMPGLNGRELARDARTLFPDLPVLFMSGYADRVFGPEGPAAAGGTFLQKPFTLDALLAKVRELLR